MTTDLFPRSGGAITETLDERARRAVHAFRALQPVLTAYARSMTGKPGVRVEMSATDNGSTDGKRIFLRPPLALGDNSRHDRNICNKRGSDGFQMCPACAVRESVLRSIYHEIAHLAFGSFERVSDHSKMETVDYALKEMRSEWAELVRARVKRANPYSYMDLAGCINQFLPFLLNCMEDARVDSQMFKVRPGTRHMFEVETKKIFEEGFENRRPDGSFEMKLWSEAPLNSQLMVGTYLKASGYKYGDYLHPDVVAALDDQQVTEIVDQIKDTKFASDVYRLALYVFARYRELGFFATDQDKNPPPPEGEPGESDQQPDQQQESDDQGDSGQPQEGTPDSDADSGSEGDSSDDSQADGESQQGQGSDDDGQAEDAGSSGGHSQSEPQADESGADRSDAGEGEPGDGGVDDRADDSDGSEGDSGASSVPGEHGDSGDQDSDESDGGEGSLPDDLQGDGSGPGTDREGSSSDEESGSAERQSADHSGSDREDAGEESGTDSEPAHEGDNASDSDESGRSDDSDAAEEEPVDQGADDGYGGTDLEGEMSNEAPEMGEPDDIEQVISLFGDHDEKPKSANFDEEAHAVGKAVIQGIYFNKPSEKVWGVREHWIDKHHLVGRVDYSVGFYNVDPERAKRTGKRYDEELDESILQPVLGEVRRAFTDNQRGKRTANKKSGRINPAALGRRAWNDDPRLFVKTTQPGKKSYAVILHMDLSGSTVGRNLALEKRAVMLQAEVLDRAGIPFAIIGHTGNYMDASSPTLTSRELVLEIYHIKDFDQPWDEAKYALKEISGHGVNLDGHALEYLRKLADTHRATDKIIMYYSDGKMPSTNHDEELDILQEEIKTCAVKGHTLLGVGIRTDSPTRHGLPTVQVDRDADLSKVVKHLGNRLSETR